MHGAAPLVTVHYNTPSSLVQHPSLQPFNVAYNPLHRVLVHLSTGTVLPASADAHLRSGDRQGTSAGWHVAYATFAATLEAPRLWALWPLHDISHATPEDGPASPSTVPQTPELAVEGVLLELGWKCPACSKCTPRAATGADRLPPALSKRKRHVGTGGTGCTADPEDEWIPAVAQRFGKAANKPLYAVQIPGKSTVTDVGASILAQLVASGKDARIAMSHAHPEEFLAPEHVQDPTLRHQGFHSAFPASTTLAVRSAVYPLLNHDSDASISRYAIITYLVRQYLEEWGPKATLAPIIERRELMEMGNDSDRCVHLHTLTLLSSQTEPSLPVAVSGQRSPRSTPAR